MCLYPRLIRNKKYIPNLKNNYNAPICEDERLKLVAVGCGKCIECTKQKANSWKVRLNEEIKVRRGIFVTLTFDDESIKKIASKIKPHYKRIFENDIAKYAIRHSLENYRSKYKKSFRHWFITELGHEGTERVHLHGIIFEEININEFWKYGFIKIGEIAGTKTINYVIKYITKTDTINKGFQGIILCSKGIGSNYIKSNNSKNNIFNGKYTDNLYQLPSGIKIAMPIYYKNKLYTEEEREYLWKCLLDRNERYVLGQKIKLNKDESNYFDALKPARRYNKLMGYGDNSKDWSKEYYKEQTERIKNYWKSK